jgi:CDP-glucose 4,6-dehydratase
MPVTPPPDKVVAKPTEAANLKSTAEFWRGKDVLVTGAGGFVGSCLANRLVELGAKVTVILRDHTGGNNFALLGLRDRVNIVNGSVTDLELVERALNEYEVKICFHLAAQAIVGVANRSPMSTFESNIRGSWVVLEACRQNQLTEAVIFASSDKAYGTQPLLPYTESMPLLGSNPYDASKACGDILARTYHGTYGMPVAIARCANIYGPGDVNFSRLIPGTIRSVLCGERPIIRSDGSPLRDYVYIDDVVNAYLALAENAQRTRVSGEAFNFGTDQPISALDLVTRIVTHGNRPDLTPEIQGKGSLSGEIDRQYMDSTKAGTVLGWSPRIGLDDGLKQSIGWYSAFLSDPK